uniref:hypothetical protein n=1 Tax=Sphingomonas sp. TaxID=28214 RepID=UPI002FCB33CE
PGALAASRPGRARSSLGGGARTRRGRGCDRGRHWKDKLGLRRDDRRSRFPWRGRRLRRLRPGPLRLGHRWRRRLDDVEYGQLRAGAATVVEAQAEDQGVQQGGVEQDRAKHRREPFARPSA